VRGCNPEVPRFQLAMNGVPPFGVKKIEWGTWEHRPIPSRSVAGGLVPPRGRCIMPAFQQAARPTPKALTFPAAVILALGVGALTALPGRAPALRAATANVDLLLVLTVDVSGSVDRVRFELQRQGYAAAFRDPNVLGAIRSGPSQAITVAVMQ
jgi:uncharacterized protein DUF1194